MAEPRSIKYNFILNLTNTVVGVIFPVITFPYVSRIIGPQGLGIINFYHSIILYITMFSSLGIASYAVREISRLNNNVESQLHTTVEVLLLHILLTATGYIAVLLIYLFMPQINAHGAIFLVLSVSIFFNTIGAVWFFQAREDFKFILVRSLAVKVLSAVALFTFVRSKDDLMWYAVILVFADAANNTLNFIRLHKYIKIHSISWSRLKIFRHLKPSIIIFAMGFIISLYLDMPSVFLGFICEDSNVGYYATTSRLTKVILSMITALGTTLLPRMTHYFASGDMKKFHELEKTGLTFTIGVTLPISVALMVIAPEVILCFSGNQYLASIPVLRILAPTILFIGIAGIAGFQVLYPQGKDFIIIRSATVGFIVSAFLNIWLIPKYAQNGASVAYLAAEVTVTLGMIILGRKYINYKFANSSVYKFVIASVAMTAALLVIQSQVDVNVFVKLSIEVSVGIIVYAGLLYLMKEELFISLLKQMREKLHFQSVNN